MPGLLINGQQVPVEGLEIVNAKDDPKATLGPGDCRSRPASTWVRQIILHTTKGIDPQRVIAGAGPKGKELAVAEFWRGDPKHSGAHLVVGRDGLVSCLADVVTTEAYHATTANPISVGIEMYQELDGGIYEATLVSAVKLVRALCGLLGIQYQTPGKAYRRAPMTRLDEDGAEQGKNLVGVIGHRDNTRRRGAGDPGDEVFRRLAADGAEQLLTDGGNDLAIWSTRQRALGFPIPACDGIPGPRTTAALKALGFPFGVWAFGTLEQRAAVTKAAAAGTR